MTSDINSSMITVDFYPVIGKVLTLLAQLCTNSADRAPRSRKILVLVSKKMLYNVILVGGTCFG